MVFGINVTQLISHIFGRFAGEHSFGSSVRVSGFFLLIKCVISVAAGFGLVSAAVDGAVEDDEDSPAASEEPPDLPNKLNGFINLANSRLTVSTDCKKLVNHKYPLYTIVFGILTCCLVSLTSVILFKISAFSASNSEMVVLTAGV